MEGHEYSPVLFHQQPTAPPLAIEIEVETSAAAAAADYCGMCSNKQKAVKFCMDCAILLCDYCTRLHGRLKTLDTHQLANLSVTVCQLCSSRNKAEQFCNECNVPVCKSCISGHKMMTRIFKNHKLRPLSSGQPVSKVSGRPVLCSYHAPTTILKEGDSEDQVIYQVKMTN